jgi:hypothetical protein
MTTEEPWKQLYRYWRSRLVAGRPPARADLDIPLEVPRLLANVMLIDLIDDRFRYRLVGSAVYERYRMELTGTWIEERSQPETDWRATLVMVRDDQIPRLISTPVPGSAEAFHIAVALPLAGPDGPTHQILAGLFFAQELGERRRVGRLEAREIVDDEP